MNTQIREICRCFGVVGEITACRQIPTGHINQTFKLTVTAADGAQTYILQNINTYVFPRPAQMMHNIDLVTRHIREQKGKTGSLFFLYAQSGLPFAEIDGAFWRMYRYLEADVLHGRQDLSVIRQTGAAFGEFLRLLSDLDIVCLYETIPAFHDTRKRYRDLLAAAESDPLGRCRDVGEDLFFLFSMQNTACQLTDALQRGELPLHIVHNDTKIDNILFHPITHQPLAIIDLDTVMPGLAAHDFGEAVRTAANTQAEDCPDPPAVSVDMDALAALTDGYLSQTASILTASEIASLSAGALVMTCENAVRFLQDYLLGDVYYHIDYPQHNLVRARCQIALAKALWDKQADISQIVAECAPKYRI